MSTYKWIYILVVHSHYLFAHLKKATQITGCSLNIVFFPKILNYSGLSLFPPGVRVYTHTRQVKHQLCSGTGRVQTNHKEKNTTVNEHPVTPFSPSRLLMLFNSWTLIHKLSQIKLSFHLDFYLEFQQSPGPSPNLANSSISRENHSILV